MTASWSPAWSPARALAWESLRLSWRPVVATTLAACALAAIYRRLLAPLGERRDAVVFASLLVLLSLVHAVTLLSCRDEGVGVGFDRRLFRLPLPTSHLVWGRLGPALLSAAAMQAVLTWFMRAVLGAPWPLLGPALLALAVASWTLTLAWTCDRRPAAIGPLAVLLLVGLLAWLKPVLRADPLWSRLAVADAAVLALATALAAAAATAGVARSRQGGAAAPSRRRDLRDSNVAFGRDAAAAVATAAAPTRPVSALRAQLWMEWREKGRWLPFAAFLWFLAAVGGSAVPVAETGAVLRQALHDYVPFAVLLLPPIAGFLHGSFRLTSRVAGIDSFRATRPLGDRQLAYAVLLSAARACAAGWAATFAAVGALALGLWRFGAMARVEELVRDVADALAGIGAARIGLVAGLGVAAAWAALGLVAAITLCGRNWLSSLAFVMPIAAVSVILIADLADVDLLGHAGAAIGPVGLLLSLGGVATWIVAVRKGLIPARSALLAAVAWTLGSVLLALLVRPLFAAPLAAGGAMFPWLPLAAPGFMAAVLLPLALAPLALRWNRHR